jgi:uncharacterized membrane protein
MGKTYDQVAGKSVERLAAISDGIFGVAMTLLLLDLHVPDKGTIHTERQLLAALGQTGPELLVYLMSFMTLGIFWVGQQTQLNFLQRSDRHLTWLHLGFLFLVTLMPVSTRVLVEFITFRSALLVYWGNIFLLGVMVYTCWGRAVRSGAIKENVGREIQAAICRRIVIAQSLYAFGFALCAINTYVSIGFIVLVQLNYVIAPFQRLKSLKADAAAGAD